ncbi:unnamed protein product [Thlaspi arvense]|uniref:DNA (cytosine-5-)-methyltransferase n=1 Tax=Thlaspi arvense TaxID=13288 RepID=A0AAU9SK73_THLAR|nr:unnamed protein product [Thlaspi arvense]
MVILCIVWDTAIYIKFIGEMAEHSDSNANWDKYDDIVVFTSSSSSSSDDEYMSESSVDTNVAHVETSYGDMIAKCHVETSDGDMIAKCVEMGFSFDMIDRAIEHTFGGSPELIIETLIKYTSSFVATCSKSKVIDYLTGEENVEEITNALLSRAEAEKMLKADNNDNANLYLGLSFSHEKNELNSYNEDGRLQSLIKMGYPMEEASIAIERCDSSGVKSSVEEVINFISAARMAWQSDEIYAKPDEEEPTKNAKKKRRTLNESPNTAIHLPKPMTGFGLPDQPGVMTERPVPVPSIAIGPPYFYYENVAMAPKGVWDTISRHLYDISPEFVDSKYFCAAARKTGYVHNLPISNRFQVRPPQPSTIQETFPLTKKWWPAWDTRTTLNCLVTSIGSAPCANEIREDLENHDGDLSVQKRVMDKCKKLNLVWVGKNKVAPLEPSEMEQLLGFPTNHTRGGGLNKTGRYKALANSFQVDTVAYHLSVLKPLFPNGINVLSLFTGIGGGEVALYRLGIPMNVVVSVEISEANRNILRSFWENTNQKGVLKEFTDVEQLHDNVVEQLMDQYGGFDLVIGGSPCNNISGANGVSGSGVEGEHSSLFYDYCRILDAVRLSNFTIKMEPKATMNDLRPRRLAFLEVTPRPFTSVLHNASCSKDVPGAHHPQRPVIEDFKIKVFENLTSKAGKVLEIGIGTGFNMRYYAARNVNVTVLGLDPNPEMKKYARKSAKRAGLRPKNFRFKQGVGEAIPLGDESVDAVVATLVLCSVSDVTQTLNEIKRVLRPGGVFIFLEHVAAKDGTLLRRLQKLLDPLQQKLADGCHLTRNTRDCILEAGFNGGAEIETVSTYSFPWVTRPHIYGVAYK